LDVFSNVLPDVVATDEIFFNQLIYKG